MSETGQYNEVQVSQLVQQARMDERSRLLARNLEEAEQRAQRKDEVLKSRDLARENGGFSQVYGKGWERLRELINSNKSAALLYSFVAENADANGGILVAEQDVIAGELGISRTTLWRATAHLEKAGALLRIKVGSGVYAYALSPDEVWKSWNTAKETAVFRTKTLISKNAQGDAFRRKLTLWARQRDGQPELPLEEPEQIIAPDMREVEANADE